MKKNFTCINCPVGCTLIVSEQDGVVTVTGNNCKIGINYGKEEYTSPKRVVTSLVKMSSDRVFSVKTDKAISKDLIFPLIKAIAKLKLDYDPKIGDIVVENIVDSGANLIATGVPTSHKS